jgi:hypothetical protein
LAAKCTIKIRSTKMIPFLIELDTMEEDMLNVQKTAERPGRSTVDSFSACIRGKKRKVGAATE